VRILPSGLLLVLIFDLERHILSLKGYQLVCLTRAPRNRGSFFFWATLVAPEVEADVEFAAFVQEPAEEGTEDGENERARDRPRVVFDHKAGDDVAGGEKDRRVQKNRKDSQSQNIEWKGQEKKHGPYEGIEKSQHQSPQQA